METLKYSFGETPVEVIREALDNAAPALEKALAEQSLDGSRAAQNRFNACRIVEAFASNYGDLFTVLIALKMAVPSFWPIPTDTKPEDTPPGKLRIDILAALGIEES